MRFVLSFIAILILTSCTTSFLVFDKGYAMRFRYRDGKGGERIFSGAHDVEWLLAAFLEAVPLGKEGPTESNADLIFTYQVDGKAISQFILYRDGELFNDGKWFVVDRDWLDRWQSKFDRRNRRQPNQAQLPTILFVTPRACARVASDP